MSLDKRLADKFIEDLLELADEQELNVYSVISDVLNGEYQKFCKESTGLELERAFQELNQAS